jgi:zinc/manganese transport system substrate-binding protein
VAAGSKKQIVATYSVLGSVVSELAGDAFTVVTAIPNGMDPHEWEPSAKEVESYMKADLIVENGLGLEGGMEKTLDQARKSGVKFFTCSDHITIRTVKPGQGLPTGDPDQEAGAQDPHLWMDPVAMKSIVNDLAPIIKQSFGVDVSARANKLAAELDALDADIKAEVATLPVEKRRLVTGHESMGYFAERYGFILVGAIIPSLSTQAEVTAGEMSKLKKQIQANKVPAIFVELGTPAAVTEALAREAKVKAVPITTHSMPADGSYFTFMRNLARTVVESLR